MAGEARKGEVAREVLDGGEWCIDQNKSPVVLCEVGTLTPGFVLSPRGGVAAACERDDIPTAGLAVNKAGEGETVLLPAFEALALK